MKEDAGELIEVVEDEGEGADVEDLLQELGDDVIGTPHRPEQPGERHVEGHQDAGQPGHLPAQQAEARVDVLGEDREEAVDDAEIVHGAEPGDVRVSEGYGANISTATGV